MILIIIIIPTIDIGRAVCDCAPSLGIKIVAAKARFIAGLCIYSISER
jgi:hypothetical protein